MASNSFGYVLRLTTWGESHGQAIGATLDGVPAGIKLSPKDIQPFLDKRKPGQSAIVTQRKEDDKINILSGVFEGKTTGAPISLYIENKDARSKDYSKIKDKFRPAHADYTYYAKYGIRDYRGGGRASARETATRVAAGAIARKIISKKIFIKAGVVQIGKLKINYDNWDWNEIDRNPFNCPDAKIIDEFHEYLSSIRKNGSSIGALCEIHAKNIPPGLGEPIYRKLDAQIANAIMSIPAVKGVEIGAGFSAVTMQGQENADEIKSENQKITFSSNNSGGILGGISSGQDIVVRFAVKPTSSILKPLETIDVKKQKTIIQTTGRHDPCVGIRSIPIAEAMMALVIADFTLIKNAYDNYS